MSVKRKLITEEVGADSKRVSEASDSKDADEDVTEYSVVYEEKVSKDMECSICMDLFISPVRLKCTHVYCRGCIQLCRDREDICPLCRSRVEFTDGYSPCKEIQDKINELPDIILNRHRLRIPAIERYIRNIIFLCGQLGLAPRINSKGAIAIKFDKLCVNFRYNSEIGSVILSTILKKFEDNAEMSHVLRALLSMKTIIATYDKHTAVGLIPGHRTIIIRRFLDMIHAEDRNLFASMKNFLSLSRSLLELMVNKEKSLVFPHLPLYSSSDILTLAQSDPTYVVLGDVLKTRPFKIPGIRYCYDKEAKELICVSPLCVIHERDSTMLEKVCGITLYGYSGFYLEGTILNLVTREPIIPREMINHARIENALINGPIKILRRWVSFVGLDEYNKTESVRKTIGTITKPQRLQSIAYQKLCDFTTKAIMADDSRARSEK